MGQRTEIERTNIRRAGDRDNGALLSLTAQTHMDGSIALRIDRKPDFFSLLRQRGDSTTLVYERGGRIIGCVSVTESQVYLNGKVSKIHYLSDLKIAANHQGKRLALELTRYLKNYLESIGADILFMVIAKGNDRMRPYKNGVGDLPLFESAGVFKVFQFLPSPTRNEQTDFKTEIVTLEDRHVKMMNNFYSAYQFGKVFQKNNNSVFMAVKEGDTILAMISLTDMSDHKQNTVMGVNGWLRILPILSKWIDSLTIPEIGEPIKIIYVNNFYYKPGYMHLINNLIDWARHYCRKQSAHFLSLGVHERDSLTKILDPKFKITFHSHAYVASLKDNEKLLNQIAGGILFEDYSLV